MTFRAFPGMRTGYQNTESYNQRGKNHRNNAAIYGQRSNFSDNPHIEIMKFSYNMFTHQM